MHETLFRVYLTGGVRFEVDSSVVGHRDFSWPRSQLALAYLVCERGRPIAGSELAEAIWSDALPADWESAVTTIVDKLRGALRRKTPGAALRVTGGGTSELRLPASVWVDVEAATAAIHDAEGALKAGRPRDAFGPSAIAHHIARRPFLPGESSRWVSSWRQRLRGILLRALECRAEIFLWNREYQLAVEASSEIVSIEGLRETGYQLLIKAHAASGNAAEAKRVYDRCGALLARELGIQPSPQTIRVYESALGVTITPRPEPSQHADPRAGSVEGFQALLQRSLGNAYTIERELSGGMSRVFVAEERALGRRVVIKVLPPEMAELVSAERFTEEVRITAKLQQANIVPVLTAAIAAGFPYYTMPFVAGQSLRALLTGMPIPIARVTSLLRDVARALAFAHSERVVHRDIKPENILLSGETAVVTDFGISKALDDSTHTRFAAKALTRTGTSLGTPHYMAPEQISADPNVDHRADIYSFGVVAYELLAGSPPFSSRGPQAVLVAHLTETPLDVRVVRPETPTELADIVMRCLEKDPVSRPSSMHEVLTTLG